MASIAPRLLRRRPADSAAALSFLRDSWMRLHGACFPCPGSLFWRSWGVAGSEISARRWWFHPPVRFGSTAVTLNTDGGFARFAVGDAGYKQKADRKQPPAKKKMSRKAKVNQLKWYRLKAKKKMKSPNPEVRIRYKLEKAKRKEEWLIEKLEKYDVPRAPEPVHDPEILTEEEKFYLKRTGEKKKNYVPVGRRGVFGGVVLNMHLHWKKHETVKVVCKPCRPGQVYEYAKEWEGSAKAQPLTLNPIIPLSFIVERTMCSQRLCHLLTLFLSRRPWRNIDTNNLLNIPANLLRTWRRNLKITRSMLLYLRSVMELFLRKSVTKTVLLMTSQLAQILNELSL